MEGYDIKNEVKPENPKALGVLGYLIVLNNQVHSYEMSLTGMIIPILSGMKTEFR